MNISQLNLKKITLNSFASSLLIGVYAHLVGGVDWKTAGTVAFGTLFTHIATGASDPGKEQ